MAFMPFATALMSSNPRARVPELVYSGTLLVAGLFQRWLFSVALHAPYVRADVPPEELTATRWRSWGLPTASALAFVGAWFLPGWNNFLLVLIPVMVRIYAAAGRRHALRQQALAGA